MDNVIININIIDIINIINTIMHAFWVSTDVVGQLVQMMRPIAHEKLSFRYQILLLNLALCQDILAHPRSMEHIRNYLFRFHLAYINNSYN